MRKLFVLSALMSIFGLSMAQEVKTYSVYDTNQSNSIEVSDVTGTIEQIKNDVAANSTPQYVTAEDLKALLQVIDTKLSKLEAIETRLTAIEEKMGIETPGMKVKTFTVNDVTFKMMPVEGGTFTMGATEEQTSYAPHSEEKPTHEVTLSDYYIGETEVTQALWYAVMEAGPTSPFRWDSEDSDEKGVGDNYPAYYISWEDCQTFITTLNTLTGATFRMPTEAEWEYAARGGSKSQGYAFSGSNTASDVAWYSSNSGSKTNPVATKSPNELGIYDMCGNVGEWCSDWFGDYSSSAQTNPTGASSGDFRIVRGGSWDSLATFCRVSYRNTQTPTEHTNITGLRLVLTQE